MDKVINIPSGFLKFARNEQKDVHRVGFEIEQDNREFSIVIGLVME